MSYLTPAQAADSHSEWAAAKLSYLHGIGELPAAREFAGELPAHVRPLVAAKLSSEVLAAVEDALAAAGAPSGRRREQMECRTDAFRAEADRYERLTERLTS